MLNNLFLPVAMIVPMLVANGLSGHGLLRRAAASAVLCALPFSSTFDPRQLPGPEDAAAMEATRQQAKALCDEKVPFVVLWPIYPFRDCPYARFMSYESFMELRGVFSWEAESM